MDKKNEQTARKNVLFSSDKIDGILIKGYDFENFRNDNEGYDKLIDSFGATGFQASHFSKAIDIVNKMIASDAVIYLGYTSNLVSSGLRDIFCYLAKHKKIKVIVTTAGGIEEDIIKCLGDFKLGEFSASGEILHKKGINRAGNIYIPNELYCKFEDFINPILLRLYEEQKKTGNVISVSELIKVLGKEINDERSIYYWCYKNDIEVYCPAITDGSLGDMIHFFIYEHPDFKIDIASDIHKINEFTITQKKTGMIILGGGVVKHHICNANMMRNGADYTVYINSNQEFDGSDAGARPDEAVSWGKVKNNGEAVKVFGDATILFPLIVARSFARTFIKNGKEIIIDKEDIEIRESKISGKGVFAKRNFKKGERICFMKGEEVSTEECVRRINENIERDEDFLQVDDNNFIDMEEIYRCINHSCSPNAFMKGKNELAALKNIKKGEEITYDYSMTMWEDKDEVKEELGRESWTMKCSCGSKNCRKIIDQFYLLPKELQESYIKALARNPTLLRGG